MGIIDDELSEIKKLCEQKIKGSRLVSCVRYMVRVEIKCTAFKTIVSCMQFTNNYPKTPILIELKSKTLSEKLLIGLTSVCEHEAKKILGKPQILTILIFLRNFLDENPLCCCYDEINALKSQLSDPNEVIKLKQRTSQVVIRITNGNYFNNFKLQVPDKYPDETVFIESVETNFPPAFYRHMLHQAKEIARKCVEPPARKKRNEPIFKASASLQKVSEFLIDCIKRLPYENCQYCNDICFTVDPKDLELNENGPKHVERIYCSHLYHMQCLIKYMKTPPFGNKQCPTCRSPIYHHKWTLSDKLAENRWAHEQAKERELAEVEDFFN
ncbi:PREDICTED: uncharacterized protein LOC108559848 [Nicrophorus vespilloides]|uniref:Uncharacterized protein LOC108559848 n=1 Tax=Nicrophorus vespilloides TaxID=110193 RepID=A0ABM1MDQ4_NICVS|nr:PREDICTED: uncharacterized protein LOC108559848 [Nicrophorus vespilloides]